eukprot:6126330-Lingulodinium_polyedra.AAC.1
MQRASNTQTAPKPQSMQRMEFIKYAVNAIIIAKQHRQRNQCYSCCHGAQSHARALRANSCSREMRARAVYEPP